MSKPQLTTEELKILQAKPMNEPDHAKIKWPKVKKWVRPKTETVCRPKHRPHPGTKRAREILAFEGRALHICEGCGLEDEYLQIHHVDCNPYNNELSNLSVLCRSCHGTRHNVADIEGVKEWYYGTKLDY